MTNMTHMTHMTYMTRMTHGSVYLSLSQRVTRKVTSPCFGDLVGIPRCELATRQNRKEFPSPIKNRECPLTSFSRPVLVFKGTLWSFPRRHIRDRKIEKQHPMLASVQSDLADTCTGLCKKKMRTAPLWLIFSNLNLQLLLTTECSVR